MHTSVSEVESLAGMNSCRIWSLYCFGFDFSRWEGGGGGGLGEGGGVTKVTLSCCINPIFSRKSTFFGYC